MRARSTRLVLVVALAAALPAAARASGADPALFETKVRPLLVERCYACHSAASPAPMGGLRLDTRAGLLKGGGRGPAIVPGRPDASLLVRAVRYADPALKMPPTGKLSDPEIASLTAWVNAGAPDPRTDAARAGPLKGMSVEQGRRHWAFLPLRRVAVPRTAGDTWSRTPIDPFILANLREKGLRPNPPASRRVLIRRASLDLIGLPPSPDAVDAFVRDPDPRAYEKLIDRLLANPRYGERWARHWLDLARFAESHGYEQDYDRPYAYQYRDFVIRAFNADLPYDTFVRWQLAGDEIDPDNPLAVMATGFLGAGTHATQITKSQVEKERYDELDDMLATTGTAMLGLTIGCARCHNHKYDPIPTADYYRMLSTFTTTVRSDADVEMDPRGYRQAKAAFDREHSPLVADRDRYEREELPARLATWMSHRDDKLTAASWIVPTVTSAKSEGGATLTELPDGSFLAGGDAPDHDTFTLTVETHLTGITAIRLEALADPSLPHGGPGRAENGNFALSDFRVTAAPLNGAAGPAALKPIAARADFEQKGLPAAAAIDDDPQSAWAVDPEFGKDHAAVFDLERPAGFAGGTHLTFRLRFENNARHAIGRPRLSLTTAAGRPGFAGPARPEAVDRLLAAGDLRAISAADRNAVTAWYRTQDPEWRALNRTVEDHLARAPRPRTEKAMICSEGVPAIHLNTQGGDFLPETYFLKRGDPNQKKGVATQSFLQVLMRGPGSEKRWQEAPPKAWRTSYRRRALASWITDDRYGAGSLLARVIVNRLWQHDLGRGIVATPSDFGVKGDPASHPELLEWLAGELIRNGWRLKPIQRLIMLSATYRESAESRPEAARLDPANSLVWKHSRRRLEAEAIRDSILAVSGELDPAMYGPGTLDEGMKRRSIYFTIKRSKLIPMMMLFDAPDSLQGIAARQSTTVAPQALLLMNNPNVRAYAGRFAYRIDPDRNTTLTVAIGRAYRIALGREPTSAERTDSYAFLRQQLSAYLLGGRRDARAAALTDFCQSLLSLNEFVYVE